MVPSFSMSAASYRGNTEDRAAVTLVDGGWLLCLADGTGGISGGARAAELFVAEVVRTAALPSFARNEAEAWAELVERADRALVADRQAGETTGIALMVTPSALVGASCGDSQAWLLTSEARLDLTASQARKPRLGSGRARACPFRAEPRGTLVVASDGLFDYAPHESIAETALAAAGDGATLAAAGHGAERLVRLVLDRHRPAPDDIAVIVGRLD